MDIQLLVKESIKRHLDEDPIMKAWRTGDLSYKVFDYQEPIQQAINELIDSSDIDRIEPYVLNCSRRFGKTTLGCLAFIEQCLKYPGTTYLFAAPTEGEAKEIILDVMPALLYDAPTAYSPSFKNSRYTFPNGSVIKIGGCYNGGETLRGRKAHGAFLDEAAHIKQTSPINGLHYVLNSVIRPQLLTTAGWCVIASTPPPQMAHEYVEVYNKARANNRLKHFTIYDNTNIDEAYIERLKKDSYDIDPTGSSWRREYLAEFAIDTRTLIIPNWTSELAVSGLYDQRPQRFEVYDRYVSYDHGTSDLSVFLFGYWHYEDATLIIERELALGHGAEKFTTRQLSEMYKEARSEVWNLLPIRQEICDAINPQVIIDFNRDFGNRFVPPRKTNLEAMVNQLANLVQTKQIRIDKDHCPLLIQTLENGTWKENVSGKKEFNRLPGIGHCDALAALIYMARAVNRHHNPHSAVPLEYDPNTQFVVNQKPLQTDSDILSRALNIKPNKPKFKAWR
jgi:hypothetical protein